MGNRVRRITAIFISVIFILISMCSCNSSNVAPAVSSSEVTEATSSSVSTSSQIPSSSEVSSSQVASSSSEVVSSKPEEPSSKPAESSKHETTSSKVSTPNQNTSSSTDKVDINYPYYGGAISCPVGSELDILAYNDTGWKLVKIDISDSGTNAVIVKGTNIVRINPSVVNEYTLTATFKSIETEAIEKPTLVITVTDSFNLSNIFSDEPGFDTGF